MVFLMKRPLVLSKEVGNQAAYLGEDEIPVQFVRIPLAVPPSVNGAEIRLLCETLHELARAHLSEIIPQMGIVADHVASG